MVNKDALKRIDQLNQKYFETWGCEVNYSIIPPGMTQEKCAKVLERIVLTGESLLVGYNKLYNKD